MPSVEVRRSSYDSAPAVALTERAQRYYRQVYGGEDSDPLDPTEFWPPSGDFVIAYAGGDPVGMGGWRTFVGPAPVPAGQPGEIRRMYVREDRRRLGIGRVVLTALETSAAAAGMDWLLLTTGQPQADAIALYRASGYVDVPRFGHYAGSDLAVHLGKPLSQS